MSPEPAGSGVVTHIVKLGAHRQVGAHDGLKHEVGRLPCPPPASCSGADALPTPPHRPSRRPMTTSSPAGRVRRDGRHCVRRDGRHGDAAAAVAARWAAALWALVPPFLSCDSSWFFSVGQPRLPVPILDRGKWGNIKSRQRGSSRLRLCFLKPALSPTE
jgi:hypothetical protein